jgi:hypothetical protein
VSCDTLRSEETKRGFERERGYRINGIVRPGVDPKPFHLDADSVFDAAEPTVPFVGWFERMTVASISGETVTYRVIGLGEKYWTEDHDEIGYQKLTAHTGSQSRRISASNRYPSALDAQERKNAYTVRATSGLLT